jgi:hypothetical protein
MTAHDGRLPPAGSGCPTGRTHDSLGLSHGGAKGIVEILHLAPHARELGVGNLFAANAEFEGCEYAALPSNLLRDLGKREAGFVSLGLLIHAAIEAMGCANWLARPLNWSAQ